MAAEVASQLTSVQLNDYGNVILNGYLEVVPNTTNVKAWQYAKTVTAPSNLPTLTEVRPALKGWTTNYAQYYTQLQPNGYSVNPGDSTAFYFNIHSFVASPAPTEGKFAQPPRRLGNAMYPVADSVTPPPIGLLL